MISMIATVADAPEFDASIAQEFAEAAMTSEPVWNLLLRFGFNFLVCFFVTRFFYYPKGGRRDYLFTFMVFSSAMFLLLFVMNNLSLEIGFTLGLFAIFGMIRYRTESVPVREMTYLFTVIALSIINGVGALLPFSVIAIVNAALVAVVAVVELVYSFSAHLSTKLIVYDRIDLIVPEKRDELIQDLHKRTGLDIKDVEIGQVDFLKDSAWVKVTYYLYKGQRNSIDSLTRTKDFQDKL